MTGLGIVSSIGNDCSEVTESLRHGKSGICFSPEYEALGFRSQVHGSIDIDLPAKINRKSLRFMGDSAAFNYIAMQEAIEKSGLQPDHISHPRTGMIMGSGGASTKNIGEFNRLASLPRNSSRWTLSRSSYDVEHQFSDSKHYVQNQGSQLFHQLRMLYQRALHWQCDGINPTKQTGCCFCGRW